MLVTAIPFSAPATSTDVVLQELDVIARRGNGMWSAFFASLSPRDKRFSHVGMLIDVDGAWHVLHAEADDETGQGQVGLTPWPQFRHDSLQLALYRPQLIDAAAVQRVRAAALAMLGRPFDLQFDLASADAVYCTELVARAFLDGAGLPTPVGAVTVQGRVVMTIEELLGAPWLLRLHGALSNHDAATSTLADRVIGSAVQRADVAERTGPVE